MRAEASFHHFAQIRRIVISSAISPGPPRSERGRRQRFLAEQGYAYDIIDAADVL